MTRANALACAAAPLALAAACAALLALRPVALKTSLYDLVGDAAAAIPPAVRAHSARLVPVVVSAQDRDAARAAADSLFARLPADCCESIRYRVDAEGLADALDAFRANRAGLVSPRDAGLLATPEGRARIARAAARRHYSSPVPPLFPAEDDPFCLLDGFVTSLPLSFSRWRPSDGILAAERDGLCHVLMVMALKRAVADDTDALVRFGARMESLLGEERAVHEGVAYHVSGVPMHTAAAAGRCKAEVGWLTCFSLVFIACLSVFAFRTARWLPLLAASLGVAAAAGALALFATFRSVHVMTLVFGTTVLGLVVDYSFHWLLQRPGRGRETSRSLVVSFTTTEISLIPLMMSSLPVLRQSAVFLGVGLAAALAFVMCCYPKPQVAGEDARSPSGASGAGEDERSPGVAFGAGGAWWIVIAVVALAAPGLARLEFGTDYAAVYRPPPALAESERLFAELGGAADEDLGFLVTSGDGGLEAALGREAAAAPRGDVPCLSRFLPPLPRREAAALLVKKLYEEHGESLRELLGLEKVSPPGTPEEWRAVPPALERVFLADDGSLVVPSAPAPAGDLPEGVSFCRPRVALADVLSKLTAETRLRLAMALALMFAALLVFFGRAALREAVPSLVAVAAVWGAVGLSGGSVNLFHLLACFLLAGMGVDYAVFLHSGGRAAFKPALCSLLTSMAGFGALAFVSFPVVKAFGAVLGLGLPVAFLCAMCTAGGTRRDCAEHGASPVGLEILFALYRVLGLRFLHFSASCVGLAVWAFSPAVRRASPSPRKVVAFTRSLADKLVVMAEGKDLPVVELDGSGDARGFAADVAAGRGVFVLSSHCGTIEALVALGECRATFHAWMEFSRTSVFNRFYMRHAKRGRVVIHPISEFGPGTVFFAGDALDAGDCLVMAGDRGFGRMRRVPFRGGEIELPEGVFRFAHALGHPVYFVACLATGGRRYRAVVRRLPQETDAMALGYAAALDEAAREFPEQWFRWEGGDQ